jgi:hypothetical protein
MLFNYSSLLLGKRTNYKINGFNYKVDPKTAKESAETISKLNEQAIKIIGATRDFIEKRGDELSDDEYKLLVDLYNNMRKNYNPDGLGESVVNSFDINTTSYTTNKGETTCICLKDDSRKYNISLLTVILVHELVHTGCSSWSLNKHNSEFWNKYKLLTMVVREAKIIKISELPTYPINYCGRVVIPINEFENFK